MDPTAIFWPMIVMALVTLGLYIPMSRSRVAGVKAGKVKAEEFRLIRDEPEESLKFTNAIRNQYETPILFYAVCLASFQVGNTGYLMVALAWMYAIVKTVHVFVHVTSNRLRYRRPLFMLAYLIIAIMWIVLAAYLAGIF